MYCTVYTSRDTEIPEYNCVLLHDSVGIALHVNGGAGQVQLYKYLVFIRTQKLLVQLYTVLSKPTSSTPRSSVFSIGSFHLRVSAFPHPHFPQPVSTTSAVSGWCSGHYLCCLRKQASASISFVFYECFCCDYVTDSQQQDALRRTRWANHRASFALALVHNFGLFPRRL